MTVAELIAQLESFGPDARDLDVIMSGADWLGPVDRLELNREGEIELVSDP